MFIIGVLLRVTNTTRIFFPIDVMLDDATISTLPEEDSLQDSFDSRPC